MVAILDADKEGFLRSERSLIQTIGRAARNAEGRVIMYADELTDSMEKAITETNRRRKIQMQYNEKHGITPQTIKKTIHKMKDYSSVYSDHDHITICGHTGSYLRGFILYLLVLQTLQMVDIPMSSPIDIVMFHSKNFQFNRSAFHN